MVSTNAAVAVEKRSGFMPSAEKRIYAIEDIESLPEGERAELIDGRIYYMSSPRFIHQKLLGEIHTLINNYIKSKGGSCEVLPAPFAVFINKDRYNYVEPDILSFVIKLNWTSAAVMVHRTGLLKLCLRPAVRWIITESCLNIVLPESVNTGLWTRKETVF